MKEGAQSILETALTNAVAGPMAELQTKHRRAAATALTMGAVFVLTGMAWVQARGQATELVQAMNILAQGYLPSPSPARDPYLLELKFDDGTVLSINLPRPPEAFL